MNKINFLIDFFKGFISVVIAKIAIMFWGAPFEAALFAGFFSVFGHIFPVFFRFKGGKGVATFAGASFALMPVITIALLILFAIIVITTKIVSLAFASALFLCYTVFDFYLSEKK